MTTTNRTMHNTPGAWGLGGPRRGRPRVATTLRDASGYPVSFAVVRAVWAFVSRHPSASVREIAAGVGLRGVGHAGAALRILVGAGYVKQPVTGRNALGRARRIVVPMGSISKE